MDPESGLSSKQVSLQSPLVPWGAQTGARRRRAGDVGRERHACVAAVLAVVARRPSAVRMLRRGGRGLLLGLAAAAAAAAAAARWLGWWSGRAGLRLFVPEELARYRGGPGDPGLYLALLGRVYDVSSGRRHYEPGAHYSGFAGTSGPALGLRGAPLRASGPPGSRQPGAPRPTLLFPSALRDVGWRDGPPRLPLGPPRGARAPPGRTPRPRPPKPAPDPSRLSRMCLSQVTFL